jgi:asparagine synthase (glutamine-hydrolysing)
MANLLGSLKAGPRVNTVSACFQERSVDEKPFVDAVVEHTNSRPRYVFPRAEDVFARAAEITWHQDEPFGSTSIFAQWCVFEEASRAGLKVMLDGQGADEQLAGYHGSYAYYVADLVRRGRLLMLARTLWERKRWHGLTLGEQFKLFVIPHLPARVRSVLPRARQSATTNPDWLASDVLRSNGNPNGAFTIAIAELGLPPASDIATLCMLFTYALSLQTLLHYEDRNSMAHSVEARVPFLDHPLVEFSLSLGNAHKIVGGDTKRVLRRAMHDILPPAVRDRRDKLGFATPEVEWLRGPLRRLVVDGVEATLRRFPEVLNPEGVRALVEATLNGDRPFDFAPWRIVNLGIWGERFRVSV